MNVCFIFNLLQKIHISCALHLYKLKVPFESLSSKTDKIDQNASMLKHKTAFYFEQWALRCYDGRRVFCQNAPVHEETWSTHEEWCMQGTAQRTDWVVEDNVIVDALQWNNRRKKTEFVWPWVLANTQIHREQQRNNNQPNKYICSLYASVA